MGLQNKERKNKKKERKHLFVGPSSENQPILFPTNEPHSIKPTNFETNLELCMV